MKLYLSIFKCNDKRKFNGFNKLSSFIKYRRLYKSNAYTNRRIESIRDNNNLWHSWSVSRFHALNIFPMASMSQLDPITSGNKTIHVSLNPPLSCTDSYVNIASDGSGGRDASTPIIYVNSRHCTRVMFLLLQSSFHGQVCFNHSKSSTFCSVVLCHKV